VSARESVRDEVGYLAGIEGLRGVAVLWVVIFHYLVLRPADPASRAIASSIGAPLAGNGYLGVDLFFLISGFLLALPWFVHDAKATPPPSIRDFYRRRFWRIVPAYYVQLLVLFAIVLPALRGTAFWRSDLYVYAYNLVAHALFLHNTTPLTSGSMAVNGALWTLAVEAQFYLLLPLAMPLFVRSPRVSLAACVAMSIGWLAACSSGLGPLVRAEMALGTPWGWREDIVRYLLAHQLPSYLAHFAIGIVLGRSWLRRGPGGSPHGADVAAIVAIAALYFFLSRDFGVPTEIAWIVPAVTLAFLLRAAAQSGTWTSRLLGRGPFAFVGRVSYSMYLYHLPLLLVASPLLPGDSFLALPIYFGIILFVSWLSWRFVEQPWLRGWRPNAALAARPAADRERGGDGEHLERSHAP
jgi:peptidoglycan/LPS O-acetylase OafA/YrhL